MILDIAANRAAENYSRWDMIRRVAWSIATPAFRLSPRWAFGFRATLLRLFGARVGAHAVVYGSVRVLMPWNLELGEWSAVGEYVLIYNIGTVVIGARATVSHGAHLCAGTHDYTRPDLPLLKLPIRIGDEAWVCADAFVGPGVTVGPGAVVGARAVAVGDVPPWTVVAGNPARAIKTRAMSGHPRERS